MVLTGILSPAGGRRVELTDSCMASCSLSSLSASPLDDWSWAPLSLLSSVSAVVWVLENNVIMPGRVAAAARRVEGGLRARGEGGGGKEVVAAEESGPSRRVRAASKPARRARRMRWYSLMRCRMRRRHTRAGILW